MELLINTKTIEVKEYKGEDLDKLNPSEKSCEAPYYHVVNSDDFIFWVCDYMKNSDSIKGIAEYMSDLLLAAAPLLEE